MRALHCLGQWQWEKVLGCPCVGARESWRQRVLGML